jgi:GNAT superfamily N-acetyltransferase
MLQPDIARSPGDLQQILLLQQQNLQENISNEELEKQGFVTLRHDLDTLQQMHDLAPSIVIRENDKIVGYALTMLRECRELIPGLEPMFALLDTLKWNGRDLDQYKFYVMGQVCIDKSYRGRGLFQQLYDHHKKIYQPEFELFITEIATRNRRSLRAHEKTGFKTIHIHRDQLDEWSVVGWDWK